MYKSLSQEECQSVRCQSEPRLPFHLSFFPVTEEREKGGGGGSTATLPTHTYTHWLHYAVEAVREQWEVGSTAFFHSCLLFLIVFCDFLLLLFLVFAFIPPHPSSFEDVFLSITASRCVACRPSICLFKKPPTTTAFSSSYASIT